jgi:simple sugar transport system ATP-binding protein
MVGKPVLLRVENPEPRPGKPVLEIRSLVLENEQGTKVLDGIDLTVHGGEIYGVAGVEGNGQTELVSSVAERVPPVSGDILLDGHSIVGLDVRKRREAGISHIPEDRHRFGLLLPFPLDVNLVLGRHHKPPFVHSAQMINKPGIREFARDVMGRFDIRAPSESTPANTLSGGNQQKVIIARELSAEPRLLLASQPTRGVDIGATEFIYQQLVKAKTEGRAVLLVSADLDEILSLSDRIGVMYKGRIIKEFSRSEAKKEEVGFYMMGEGRDVKS